MGHLGELAAVLWLSKFRINVRLSVQHKCPLLSLLWYQMLAPEELPGFAASAGSRRRCISLPSLCGFPTPSPSVEWTSPGSLACCTAFHLSCWRNVGFRGDAMTRNQATSGSSIAAA